MQETGEEGNTTYINKKVMGSVAIIDYRTPSLQDGVNAQEKQIVNLNAQVAYLSMMPDTKTEVSHE